MMQRILLCNFQLKCCSGSADKQDMSDDSKPAAPEPKPGKSPTEMIGLMPVEKFMVGNVISVTTNVKVRDAIKLLLEKQISGVPIVDVNQILLTVATEFDLMQFAARGQLDSLISQVLDRLPAKEKLYTVKKGDNFKDAFKFFLANGVRRVIVVGVTGKVDGIVARRDILRAFMMNDEASAKKAA
jgi:predicted transcriptional regulator